jgi:bifunctional non-homologous end joining protein LigD
VRGGTVARGAARSWADLDASGRTAKLARYPSASPNAVDLAAEAFDHPDWLFELKHDGFRALALVDGHQCTLVSRRRHIYRQFPQLQVEISHSIRAHSAVLDGEILCLASDGRSLFNRLLFRRDWPHFIAFDVLSIDGEDLRERPLVERKRRLLAIMPRIDSRLLYLDHVAGRGVDLYRQVCRRDLEGIVAKWRFLAPPR